MAAMENLFSGAICGIIYHLCSGQPLTIIGSTGPVLVFETIVYDMCSEFGWDYLSFRTWINFWTAFFLLIITLTDSSASVKYITRFTEESFAALIAFIFIYEAFAKLLKIKDNLQISTLGGGDCECLLNDGNVTANVSECSINSGTYVGDDCYVLYDKFLMSIILMFGTFILSIALKKMRLSGYLPTRIREVLSDFAVIIAIALMTSADIFVGINTPKLTMPSTFTPTYSGRGWFIPPFGTNPYYTAAFAAIPAVLSCILIFLDQQITAVIVNRKEYKLKKGSGYHLDLFVLSILILITGYLGLPIYVAATVLSINHVTSLKVETEASAPGEPQQFLGVRKVFEEIEQRLTGVMTFILIGVSVFMSKILCYIPMPVLYGVFLYMGINALGTLDFFERICLLLMPMKYQPDRQYIRHVPIKIIHFFTFFQIICLGSLWAVKSIKKISILFPIM
uniref:Bicarbonate transporter-like transmembrane domain-containing protein n=1 Tax=Panagrolaimus superbus TaxID=310955 RepID=A0A914YL97_9BILA